jgi:phosphoglycerate dehydrogenase-like enzyme
MGKIIAWTQWADLKVPGVIELRSELTCPLETSDLSDINFYVPHYFGGAKALNYVNQMPQLKYLQMPNAGYDDALDYVREGLIIANAAGVHDDSTAELAVGLAIASRRGFVDFVRAQDKGEWAHQRYTSFSDSKIGLIGHGSIGKTITKNLSGFAVEVVPFTRSGTDGSVKILELDKYLPTFDIIILILPLTPESRHLFGKERLSLMKDGALIVNVARGAIIDSDALLTELQSQRIYAALDVTDPEPLPQGHALWGAPNLIIAPHVGGDSTAFEPRARRLVEGQLERLVRGEEIINIVARGRS